MTQPYTYAGVKLYISDTAQNTALADATAFEALDYTQISNIGNIGAYGFETNMVSYPVMDRSVSLKAKGETDGGNMTFQVADDPADQGQIDAAAAADPESQDNYVIKIEFASGVIHYLRGPMGGPTHPGGGNEDFVVSEYTIGVNQILEVPAP